MESAQRDARVGVVLNGRYRITELLGEGGMGAVYRGERLQLGRPVAIKFLHVSYAKSPKFVARFEREARAMSKLSHPYCVSVIDFGVHDEPYIVMDFVVGTTLRELMDAGRLAPQRAVQITRQILAGLAHAHDQGVIHRDVKPGNVMVGEATGVGDHVRIFDFGLAKLHDATVEGDHSVATVIGTPSYMAPEQTRAEPIDARADLYATGVLLFEMLTGEKPFTGDDAYEVIRKQREEPPRLVASLAPTTSAELEQVVQKALQKEPGQRYQSATEFVAALDAVPEAHARTSALVVDPAQAVAPAVQPGDGSSARASTTDRPGSTRRQALLGLLALALLGLSVYFGTRPVAREAPSGAPREAAPLQRADASAARVGEEPTLVVAPPSLDAAVALPSEAGEPSDAGAGAPSEAELRLAASTLDVTEEQEAAPVAAPGPPVRSISDVHKLIDQKQYDAAIFGLKALREKSPYNPYYPYLLGDLYFERGFWGDGLAKYREAIRLNDGYKRRATIHENAIRALGSDLTYVRAFVLLEADVGDAALPALQSAAQNAAEPVIAERARLLAERLAR